MQFSEEKKIDIRIIPKKSIYEYANELSNCLKIKEEMLEYSTISINFVILVIVWSVCEVKKMFNEK